MRRGVQLSIVVAAASGVVAGLTAHAYGAFDSSSKPVRFSSVLRGAVKTVQTPARPDFVGDNALVLPRISDLEIVLPSFIGDRFVPRLEKTPWSRSFLIAVAISRDTTGYAVRVKRITFQRVNANLDQFCVVASIRKPRANAAVEHRRTTAYEVVTVPRAGFGLSVTRSAVLRDATGRLLSRGGFNPIRAGLCRA
jgi:hypothetical protein